MKLYLFYCSNSVDCEELHQCCSRLKEDDIKLIDLPCSGKVTIPYLMKAFETGADGVLILTCKVGDCHYLEGNLRAGKRAEMVGSLLEEIGLGNERISLIHWTDEGIEQAYREIEKFREKIKSHSANKVAGSPN
ncbi:MAG: hydrogenase iron-sulfur subunit [Sedimentisphaerales bacterium]|nr:hydrogenase iron-sulfur subunit [Sedimentisphaerales bacterium]